MIVARVTIINKTEIPSLEQECSYAKRKYSHEENSECSQPQRDETVRDDKIFNLNPAWIPPRDLSCHH